MCVAGISEGDEPSTHVGVTMVASVTNAVVAIDAGRLLLLFPLLKLVIFVIVFVLRAHTGWEIITAGFLFFLSSLLSAPPLRALLFFFEVRRAPRGHSFAEDMLDVSLFPDTPNDTPKKSGR